MADDTKKCPYCAETIKAEAIVCRYCGRDLPSSSLPTLMNPVDEDEKPEKKKLSGLILFLLVVLFFLCSKIMTSDFGDNNSNVREPNQIAEVRATVTLTPNITSTPKNTNTPKETSTPTPKSSLTPAPITSAEAISGANLRSGPGTNYDIVGSIQAGDTLSVFARTNDGWFQVDSSGQVWIGSSLVKIEIDLSEIPIVDFIPLVSSETSSSIKLTPTGDSIITPTQTITPSPTFTLTPIPDTPGITDWMIYDGMQVGIREMRWDRSLGYFRPEEEKIYLSVYVIAINLSEKTQTFYPSDFDMVDGGGQISGHVIFGELDPTFTSCTVRTNGVCEGWWTTMIWDREEVKRDLSFRWGPCLITCSPLETPIFQEE